MFCQLLNDAIAEFAHDLVVENGRITDVVYSEAANGPVQPTKYDEAPALVIPRRPPIGDPSYFNGVAGGYTGPVTPGDDLEWSFTGPVGGSTGPVGSPDYPVLRGHNSSYRRFT